MTIRITCIKKAGGQHENPHVAISDLGWVTDETGVSGRSTRLEVYEYITQKGGRVYVKDSAGNKAYLVGKISPRGTKYVQTQADGISSDNLLKLPECK